MIEKIFGIEIGQILCLVPLVDFVPLLKSFLPKVRHLRQHADTGAHVFAPLCIVSGGGQHGSRMRSLGFRAEVMKLLNRDAKSARVAAYFVQGNESVVIVEGSVLHAFGHGGSTELLKAHDKFGFERAAHP